MQTIPIIGTPAAARLARSAIPDGTRLIEARDSGYVLHGPADLSGTWTSDAVRREYTLQSVITPGQANCTYLTDASAHPAFMRVVYPAGSSSPGDRYDNGDGTLGALRPAGGALYSHRFVRDVEQMQLTYWVRFAANFDPRNGGKLPGPFGGAGNTGGLKPTGYDGWSGRVMFNDSGSTEIRLQPYLYLYSNPGDYGWPYTTNYAAVAREQWHKVQVQARMNTVGVADGIYRLFVNDALIADLTALEYRKTPAFGVSGWFFHTNFGGHTEPGWGDAVATLVSTHADFADFATSEDWT